MSLVLMLSTPFLCFFPRPNLQQPRPHHVIISHSVDIAFVFLPRAASYLILPPDPEIQGGFKAGGRGCINVSWVDNLFNF